MDPETLIKLGEKLAPIFARAVDGARDLDEILDRFRRAAKMGDLDDALRVVGATKHIAQNYVDNG